MTHSIVVTLLNRDYCTDTIYHLADLLQGIHNYFKEVKEPYLDKDTYNWNRSSWAPSIIEHFADVLWESIYKNECDSAIAVFCKDEYNESFLDKYYNQLDLAVKNASARKTVDYDIRREEDLFRKYQLNTQLKVFDLFDLSHDEHNNGYDFCQFDINELIKIKQNIENDFLNKSITELPEDVKPKDVNALLHNINSVIELYNKKLSENNLGNNLPYLICYRHWDARDYNDYWDD